MPMSKSVHEFELQGLSKPRSFTCRPLYADDHFWATSDMPYLRFNALFDYYSGRSSGKGWKVKIEHDGLTDNGTPINPIVIDVIEP